MTGKIDVHVIQVGKGFPFGPKGTTGVEGAGGAVDVTFGGRPRKTRHSFSSTFTVATATTGSVALPLPLTSLGFSFPLSFDASLVETRTDAESLSSVLSALGVDEGEAGLEVDALSVAGGVAN